MLPIIDIIKKISLKEKKQSPTGPILVFSLGEEIVSSAIFEIDQGDGKITAYGTIENWDGESSDSLIIACDSSISAAVSSLSEIKKKPADSALIGFSGSWLEKDSLKKEKEKLINKLCSELKISASLSKIAVTQEAVAQFLTEEEGGLTNIILINLFDTKIIVSLIINGKCLGSKLVDRSENLALDVDEGLQQFEYHNNLPSRFLLYGKGELEGSKQTLITYPWTDSRKNGRSTFFQLPKIEVLNKYFEIDSLVNIIGSEMFTNQNYKNEPNLSAIKNERDLDNDPLLPKDTEIFEEKNEFGFVKDIDILENDNLTKPNKSEIETIDIGEQLKEIKNRDENTTQYEKKKNILEKKDSIYTFFRKLLINKFIFVLLLVILAGGAGFYGLFFKILKAEVEIMVKPFFLNKEILFSSSSTKEAKLDIEKRIVPSYETSIDLSGSKKTEVRGKKIIGEKAAGEVIIYNRTETVKIIPKGTIIKTQELKYVLDQEVKIASKTADLENGIDKWGETKAKIIAYDIGAQYNLSVNQSFVTDKYPTSSLIIKNSIEISGGTSREIQAVSKEDRENLQKNLEKDLFAQATEKIKDKLGPNDHLLDEAYSIKTKSLSYDKEIGAEASEVSVEGTISFAFSYFKENEVQLIIDSQIKNQIPADYQSEPFSEKKEYSFVDKNKRSYMVKIENGYYPIVDREKLSLEIKGRSIKSTGDIIKKNTLVNGYKIKMKTPFARLKTMPFNPDNITIIISQTQ